jgi:5-methylcytosine-specific restriction protein A
MPRAPKAPNEHAALKVPWAGSTRRERRPANWPDLKRQALVRNPRRLCHLCGEPDGDALDHLDRTAGDGIENLDWAHEQNPPHCHRYKSAREGVEARRNRA